MKRPRLALCALLALATVLAACGEAPDDRPGQPVTHRRAAFKTILRAFEPIGVQLRDGPFDAKRFAEQAPELAKVADGPWAYFGPDTNYPPTKAKPALWQQPERFAQLRDEFKEKTGKLAALAGSTDQAAIRRAYEAVHETCRSCHREFKE
jgi:cytochrome c556